MATYHEGNEGQRQKLHALEQRQKRLKRRAMLLPPLCWTLCAAAAPFWFPWLKAQTAQLSSPRAQAWILLLTFMTMLSLPVLAADRFQRKARGAKYAATLVSSGIRGEDEARALLRQLPSRVHLYPNRIVRAGNRSECDLVALCRRGATVIEVKNHNGVISGDLSDHDLTLTRKNGTTLSFYNPALQVTTHAQTLARALAEQGVPCPVRGCVLFIREGTTLRLSDRFRRRRQTPVFTRKNRFRLRWYILHRGKRIRRREFRQLRRLLDHMK